MKLFCYKSILPLLPKEETYGLKGHLISCFESAHILKEGLVLVEGAKKILNGYIEFVKKQKGING